MCPEPERLEAPAAIDGKQNVRSQTTQPFQNRRYSGRRNRQGGRASGMRGARSRREEAWLRSSPRYVRFLVVRLLRSARNDASRGLEEPDRLPRRDLLRGGRLAREDPGSRVAMGFAAAIPARVRSVREPSSGPPDARRSFAVGEPQAWRYRFLRRAREYGRRVFLDRRPDVSRNAPRDRHPGNCHDARRASTAFSSLRSTWPSAGPRNI